jgi:hypothetical protein
MSKSSRERPGRVEIQKGPIDLNAQYTNKFNREPEKTIRDIQENSMRRYGQTLELHTPKR